MSDDRNPAKIDPQAPPASRPLHYGSVPTLFGAPPAEKPGDLSGIDVAYLGIPWSAPPSAGRSASIAQFAGTSLTPDAMRTNSIKYGGYLPELELNVFEHLKVADYGNVDVSFDIQTTWNNVGAKVTEILSQNCIPFTMGGNAGASSFAVLKAIAEATEGKVAVVNLDAHGDNYRETQEERFSKRNPRWGSSWTLRSLEDIPNVDPSLYVHVGLRGPRNDPQVIDRFLETGVPRRNILTYADIKASRRGFIDDFAEQIAERVAGADRVWFAVDPDVLDMSVSPQFGDEPLGLSVDEMVHIAYAVGRKAGRDRFAGIGFMATPYDAHTIQWIELYTVLYALAGIIHSE